ncbi:hypothetical protein [Acidiphilium sp.]|uniref:hypothetical protein n=1 Tax=Acidiphilium sp. TaxID=527 RepID=UPI0025826784|nr:hypothetical protein [Acidiphilium sp.]
MSGNAFFVSTRAARTLFGKATDAQVNKALAIGLTRIGVRIKDAAALEMRSVFDRPTPYTMKALQLKSAEKTHAVPRAFVGFKDKSGSFIANGADAGAIMAGRAHYLRPQVFGGSRPLKALESRLRRAGAMGAGQYALPGWAAKMDAYGNMSKGEIVQVLAYVGGFGEVGGDKNTTAAGKARLRGKGVEYFALKARRGGLGPGIYRRLGRGGQARIQQVLKFIDRTPQYRVLFDFFGVAERTAAAHGEEIMRDALAQVLFTGKG